MPVANPILQLVPPPEITFEQVYRENFAYVWRVLRRCGVGGNDAEDAAQEVFFRFHERFQRWDQQRPVRPFLSAFAFRVASERRRRASVQHEQLAADSLPETADGGDARLDGRVDAMRMLVLALEGLPEDQLQVVILHLIEERPMREVAEMLGEKENTCSSRLRYARERFEPVLRRLLRGGS